MGFALFVLILLVAYMLLNQNEKPKREKPVSSCPSNVDRSFMGSSNPTMTPVIDDYNDYLLTAGLEKSVVDSHRQFVNDIAQTTTGASAQTVLSGDIMDNPFVGLRRPDYRVEVDPNARQVPSAEQWQYPTSTKYDRSGLF